MDYSSIYPPPTLGVYEGWGSDDSNSQDGSPVDGGGPSFGPLDFIESLTPHGIRPNITHRDTRVSEGPANITRFLHGVYLPQAAPQCRSPLSHDPRNSFIPDMKPPNGPPTETARGTSSGLAANAIASGSAGSSNSAHIVIACRQCRARKIKCDSQRPVCTNCTRRSNACEFDAAPKRRGPDKEPGTRKRSCKKRPVEEGSSPLPAKKKRETRAQPTPVDIKESSPDLFPSTRPFNLAVDTRVHPVHGMSKPELTPLSAGSTQTYTPVSAGPHSYASNPQLNLYHGTSSMSRFGASPVSAADPAYRQAWWDDLLREYSAPPQDSMQDIIQDLQFLFEATTYWLSFINAPVFLSVLAHPHRRLGLQPALILAGLALSTLMKSSQTELGHAGRERALWLRRRAQEKLEASWDQGWVDPMLAEAAMMLALFESCPHPRYEPTQEAAAIKFLDEIIRTLGLTSLDSQDPDVSSFQPREVPVVFIKDAEPLSGTTPTAEGSASAHRNCACLPPATISDEHHYATSWSYPLPWDPDWTAQEARNEASRRLVWSALNLVAIYTSQCSVLGKTPGDLHLSDPANFSVLFPGEVSDRLSPNFTPASTSPKDSVWALYCRSMLLWNFAGKLPTDAYDDAQKTTLSMDAWQETQAIEDALDTHTCNLDTVLLYMCREYLNNARMGITQCFRSLQGLDSAAQSGPRFTRAQANEWIRYQLNIIRRAESSITNLECEGHVLTRRPFQAFWFTTQLNICMSLWRHDGDLVDALKLARSVLVVVDVLNLLWPCAYQQARCEALRLELQDACLSRGLPPVLPVGYINLPVSLRSLTA